MKTMYQKPVAEFINLANEDVLTAESGNCRFQVLNTWEEQWGTPDECANYELQFKVGGVGKCEQHIDHTLAGIFSVGGEQW